jgi:probable F420-dependent oxidoreductase
VKFDLMLNATPDLIRGSVQHAVDQKMDGGWVIETKHDPFLLLNTAAHFDSGLRLGTAVAVGFARSPMLLALLGNDLQYTTGGKFVLGLGTQVKPHIERRYSMPWGKPVGRMRELLTAVHAIWDSWETGERLAHEGEYYTHTLMTPAFSPGPNPHGRPPIYLGALGPAMTELAGQLADGLVVHRFVTERFIREVTIPRVQAGLSQRARPLDRPFEIVYPPFVATGEGEAALEKSVAETRAQIAFYASTPAYRTVLDLHGWGDLGEKLHGLSREGRWSDMSGLFTDDVLDAFAVVEGTATLRQALETRFDGAVERIVLYPPDAPKQH